MNRHLASVVLLALSLVAGCGSLRGVGSERSAAPAAPQPREVFDRSSTEWLVTSDKPAHSIVLGQPVVSGNRLLVPVKCYALRYEIAFDEYYWRDGTSQTKPAYGYRRKNVRPTGAQRRDETPCGWRAAQIILTGLSSDGESLGPAVTGRSVLRNGRFAFPLKRLAESLSERPQAIVAAIAPTDQPGNVARALLGQPQLEPLRLRSENWLSPEALTTLLMTRISSALKTKDYRASLPWFKRLDERVKNLPQDFHYYYIVALAGAGEHDTARSRIRTYLARFGKEGKYSDQVIAQRDRLPRPVVLARRDVGPAGRLVR